MLDDNQNILRTDQTLAIANRLLEALSFEYKKQAPKAEEPSKPVNTAEVINTMTLKELQEEKFLLDKFKLMRK